MPNVKSNLSEEIMKLSILMLFVMLSTIASAELTFNFEGGSVEEINFRRINEGEKITVNVGRDDSSSPMEIFNTPEGSLWLNDVFEWTPGRDQDGVYSVSVLYNGEYSSFKILVSNTQFDIQFGQLFKYLFTATDPDSDQVEITIKDLPTGATFTGGQFDPKLFSWNPTEEQIGEHSCTLTATDNPVGGVAKVDVLTLNIRVTRLSSAQRVFDFDRDDKVNLSDFSQFSKNWLAGSPEPDPNNAPTIPDVVVKKYVYKTVSGSKYHKIDCSYLKKGSIRIELGQAQEDGLTGCSRCKPDDGLHTSYSKRSIEEMMKDIFGDLQKIVPKDSIEAPIKEDIEVDLKTLSMIMAEEWLNDLEFYSCNIYTE
jgi:hypothetical protein